MTSVISADEDLEAALSRFRQGIEKCEQLEFEAKQRRDDARAGVDLLTERFGEIGAAAFRAAWTGDDSHYQAALGRLEAAQREVERAERLLGFLERPLLRLRRGRALLQRAVEQGEPLTKIPAWPLGWDE